MRSLTSFCVLLASATVSLSAFVKDNFELLILHNNDMHARFEQTSQLSGACSTADRELGKCYGGFPRVAHVVKEARKAAQSGEGPPVLYLNAGDTYTGTAWFTIYKWKIAAEFINALQPDAVSLGSNDIDKETDELSPLMKNIETKILASNVILKSAKDNQNMQKFIIFDINGVRVGIVGYVTPVAEVLDTDGDVEYVDEVIAVREEVNKLQALNVNIIIALGHSTHEKDLEIGREVDGIDFIIAGQKNKFYWDGRTANAAAQPTVVTQNSGRTVPVIVSTSYNQNLGKMLAQFNEDGEIISWDSEPIYLAELPQDEDALQIIKAHSAEIVTRSDEVLGQTAVVLDGSSCKFEECNLGNFVADAISYYYAVRHEGETWTDAALTIVHSGAIAASIAPSNRPAPVTRGDLLAALPVESNLVAVTMTGTVLNQVLEHSVSTYDKENPTGQLLQFSGIRVTYDLSREPGSRLVEAVVRCWSCFVPEYYVIDDWRTYKVLMPAALADGEFGYSMLVGLQRENLSYDEATCTAEYIGLGSPVYPEVAERVVLNNEQVDEVDTPEPEVQPTTAPPLEATTAMPAEVTTAEPGAASGLTASILIVAFMPLLLNIRNLSLGNHELDNGVSGLTPFIENLTCPVLAANLILTKEPTLEAEANLMKSVVFDVNGTKVGVIGYLTPETKILAIRNNVEYIEETEAISEEAAKLKSLGINILIALGHSGFTKDLEIAEKCEDIDLVIGGHTNTFLWNGTSPDVEKPEGPYPTVVKQKSGRLVPAVQAYAYTKYLGNLHIVFDNDGEIVSFDGNPILLDNTVPQDPECLGIVNLYKGEVMKVTETIVGNTSVIIDGHTCRLQECNMGNLITDAMVHKYAAEYRGIGWTDAPIAIIQGGGIRSSIAHLNLPANVTKGDLLTVMPFDGNMVKIAIKGWDVLRMLEHSVAKYSVTRSPGQFLQMSGLKVEYDFRKKRGSRVTKVEVRCGTCEVPTFLLLNKSEEYKILMPSFLSMGGDGYSVFDGLPATSLVYDELQSTIEYIQSRSPVYPAIEGRIVLKTDVLHVNSGLMLSKPIAILFTCIIVAIKCDSEVM